MAEMIVVVALAMISAGKYLMIDLRKMAFFGLASYNS
jgi:hypothetical protein